MEQSLTWDDTFEIAFALKQTHPGARMEEVSLAMILAWTTALPEFCDDPHLANDSILLDIFQEWFEEVNPL
jgi:FeS assembly protein IscX